MNEISGRESLLSSLDNHNKDICEIQNYFVNRESAELLLSRREKKNRRNLRVLRYLQ